MRSSQAILLAMLVPACASRPPPRPRHPPAHLVRLLAEAPPARAGHGRIAIDVPGVEAVLYRRIRHGDRMVIDGPLCGPTPCVLDLPIGVHEIVFSDVVVAGRLDRARLTFMARPQVYERAPPSFETNWPELLAGVALTGFGTLFTAGGISIIANPRPHAESGDLTNLGVGILVFGAGVLTGGVALLRISGTYVPPHEFSWPAGTGSP